MLYRISPHVEIVFTEDGFTSGNSVFIRDDISLLIDSGSGSSLLKIDPSNVDILINSHHHLDHVRGNDMCTRAEILMHQLEKEAMAFPEKISATWGWDQLMEEDVFECAGIFGGLSDRLYQPWRVDGTIQDEQLIDCGHTTIRVLHTPGHTAGHCAFHFPGEGLVFLGDICMTAVGPWYGDEFASVDDFIASINKIIDIQPAKIVSGHRPNVIADNVAGELVSYRDRIHKREQRVFSFISENPSTINEIASQRLIYREHPTYFVLFWEKTMVKKHLENGIMNGMVVEEEKGRYRALKTAVLRP